MKDLVKHAERFARERHAGQCRKGTSKEPYTIHLEEVATLVETWGGSHEAIAAAWLHDTVEDCPPTSFLELTGIFGSNVSNIVRELTDDKSLPKQRRKDLQIFKAPQKTPMAALVKLADKSSNVLAIAKSPPSGWSLQRRLDYIEWAKTVVRRLPQLLTSALKEFENRCDIAELQTYIDLGSVRQAQNASLRIMERKALRAGASQKEADEFLLRLLENSF